MPQIDLDHLQARMRERLDAYLRLPSVSTDPAYQEGMAGARAFLVSLLTELGFDNAQTLSAGGHPAVYGQWLGAPGAPTYLIYGHYDVQPPDPLDKWTTPAFEPTERNGRLYARGASDDKGPVLIALYALGAVLAEDGRLPFNVRILIEGEEEIGSRTLAEIIASHPELIKADAVLSADGGRWRPDLASVNVGTRGNTGFEFSVITADKDLHSGRYGGILFNANHVVARIVASLHHDDGTIAVPGFYDGIVMPDEAELAATHAIDFDDAAFFAGLGAAPHGEAGYSTLERLWFRPTLEVNGLGGGYQGPGTKTVIPDRAFAKLTMRLVPGQDPAATKAKVIAHIEAQLPQGVRLEIAQLRGDAGAYLLPADHPLLAMVERAMEKLYDQKPLRVRIGASLPINDVFKHTLGIDTVMFSFSTADEDYHAPNEFIRVSALREGLQAWISLIQDART